MAPFLIPLVTSVAPALVKLATGSDRAEEVARSVSGAVERITGVTPDTPDKAREAMRLIEADPQLHVQLTQELRAIESAELEMMLKDRQDARSRDIALRRLTGGRNLRANIMLGLAFLAIIAIAVVLMLLNLGSEGQSGQQLQFTGAIIGFLTGVGGMFARNIGSAFDFEFGSSRGSKDKDGHIETLSQELSALRPSSGAPAPDALSAFRKRLAG
ncbi:MAG: hypothetical protein ACQEUZ_18320 [Pseudomonadota bacterium]